MHTINGQDKYIDRTRISLLITPPLESIEWFKQIGYLPVSNRAYYSTYRVRSKLSKNIIFKIANLQFWRGGWDDVKRGIVILARCKIPFILQHENLV